MASQISDDYLKILRIGQRFPGPSSLRINQALAAIQCRHLEEEIAGTRPVVWASPLVPSEILTAFGLGSVTPETISAYLATAKMGGELIQHAEGSFLSGDCCSFQTMAVAALDKGLVPVPKAFIATSPICDDNPKMSDALSQAYRREKFWIDVPAGRDGDDPEARQYVAGQLRQLVSFLEVLTGQSFDAEKLRAGVEESNRARRHWAGANGLRRTSAPVMQGVAALRLAGGLLLQKLGTPELTEVLSDYEAELRERIGAGKFISARKRLLWLHLFPLYDAGFMKMVETDLSMVVAFEESSHVWWDDLDPDDPLTSLAGRILSCPLAGPVTRRIASIRRLVRDYRIDAVVHFSHQGCKALSGGAPLIGRALRADGVPFLELSGDCLNNRSAAQAQWKARLEAFAEMLG